MTNRFKKVKEDSNKEESERLYKTANSFNDFAKFYEERKIYFPTDICKKLDDLRHEFLEIFTDYSFEKESNEAFTKEKHEKIKAISEKARKEVPDI